MEAEAQPKMAQAAYEAVWFPILAARDDLTCKAWPFLDSIHDDLQAHQYTCLRLWPGGLCGATIWPPYASDKDSAAGGHYLGPVNLGGVQLG
jgi:hypothetical protein